MERITRITCTCTYTHVHVHVYQLLYLENIWDSEKVPIHNHIFFFVCGVVCVCVCVCVCACGVYTCMCDVCVCIYVWCVWCDVWCVCVWVQLPGVPEDEVNWTSPVNSQHSQHNSPRYSPDPTEMATAGRFPVSMAMVSQSSRATVYNSFPQVHLSLSWRPC